MIRVGIVEDQTIVRQGLRSLLDLADDIEVVVEAADGMEALSLIPQAQVDVVLLDVRMPRLDGIGVLNKLRELGRLPPTLVLTTFDDHSIVLDAIRGGARGFMLKDVSLEQLTGAIRTLAAGGTLISPAITARILERVEDIDSNFESIERPEPLTDRESEVLRLIAAGYSNREIARAFGVTEGTIKNHTSSILSKLGVRDRTRAVLKALECGYL